MKLYDTKELKDSRIFYEQKSPKIISYILIMVSVLLIILLVFLSIAQKTYAVEASGYVMGDDTTYVSSSVNGTINKLYKEEGDYVEKGEMILEVTRESNKTEIDTLHQKLNLTNRKLDAIDLFDQSLKQDINYLDNTKEQQEYYEKMNYYLLLKSEEDDPVAGARYYYTDAIFFSFRGGKYFNIRYWFRAVLFIVFSRGQLGREVFAR